MPVVGNQAIICLINVLVSVIRWRSYTVILRVGDGITLYVSCLVAWKIMKAPIGDRASWVIVTCDTAGEVIFATARMLKHQGFNSPPNMNYVYFRLRHQYHLR